MAKRQRLPNETASPPKALMEEEEALASHPDDCRCSRCSAHEERMRRVAADLGEANRYLDGMFARASKRLPKREPVESFAAALRGSWRCSRCGELLTAANSGGWRFREGAFEHGHGEGPALVYEPARDVSASPLPPPTRTTEPQAEDRNRDPWCPECGHLASDHRPQIHGGSCGATRRCACRIKDVWSSQPGPQVDGWSDTEKKP